MLVALMTSAIYVSEANEDARRDNNRRTATTLLRAGVDAKRTLAYVAQQVGAEAQRKEAERVAQAAAAAEAARVQAEMDAEIARQQQAEADAVYYQTASYQAPVATGATGDCAAYGYLGEIAQMESGCRDVPNSGGSGATGYLQFMPGTFEGVCGTCCDIHSLDCQMQAGQVMLDQGRQCEWAVLGC